MGRTLVAGMTISAAVGALGVMTVSIATAASGPGRSVTVKPRVGSPATTFSVSFRAPNRTGMVGPEERYYVVSATGPSGQGGCVGQVTQYAGAPRAHARVRAKMKPVAGGWCSGTFHGTVTEQERPACPYREVCPMYIVLVRTIGRFTFRARSG